MSTYYLILHILVSGVGQEPINILSTVEIKKSIESCKKGGTKFIQNAIYAELPDLEIVAAAYQCIKNENDVTL